MKPLVTVIMAVYNGEKYLAEAIESALAQTYQPLELLIINDGSEDGTDQIVQSYGPKIRYYKGPNRGQPAAQNKGLLMARGSYITFLDADDLYYPDKTALQVAFLEDHPEIDYLFGHVKQFFSPDVADTISKKRLCPTGLMPGYLAAAGLFRKECFEKVGLFNEELSIGLFVDWYMRSTEQGLQQALIPEAVFQRRIHDNNMGIYSKNTHLHYMQVIKTALKRRLLTEKDV